MAKKLYQEAVRRIFTHVFVCKVCKSKIRADPRHVRLGKVKCRKCGSHQLRPKNRPTLTAGK
jgi:ribosomal protein L40E